MTALDVSEIAKTYRKRGTSEPVRAVDGISFRVERGQVVGLLGPNGAGKTTTMKIVCGLLRPDRGSVTVCGIDNRRQRQRALRHLSAVLEGNRNLYWRLTARENLEYFAGNRGLSRRRVREEIARLLAMFRLEAKANEQVNALSRGMQQKLAIAVAMLAGSEVMLLDEPTLGLDVETGYEIRDILRRVAHDEGRTILLSSHDMPVVEDLCQRAIIISDGHVVADDEVDNLMALFATRAYTLALGDGLTEEQRGRLRAAFPGASVEASSAGCIVHVELERSEDVYELIDILSAAKTPIESIDRVTVDFEQVFRRLVARRHRPAAVEVGRG